ncbi:MAG: cobalamin biosynthesis protein CobD [Thermoflavifilum sp.]|nr:cobalamin biosynthesis protein CobD [Thermoflavifilum sp.]MCL6514387.1 adenosylcobinamide-phosphate synthase CbiB [Alicyclobacillus sp.]
MTAWLAEVWAAGGGRPAPWPALWAAHAVLGLGALGVDLCVGDPPRLPHPVVLVGRMISALERRWNISALGDARRRVLGACMAVAVLATVLVLSEAILWLAGLCAAWLHFVLALWLSSTTIAWRGLVEAGRDVYRAISRCGLDAGRRAVGRIVGRDTDTLSEPEVVRAAVETLAENIVDAVVSPLLFALVAGAPGALLYRAINTLDSMVGYRNDRFRAFGWASARLDDAANYLPARLTGWLILPLAARVCGLNARQAFRIMRRDARKHPSPNSGFAEAAAAGALGVTLGGLNTYGGVPSLRPRLGEGQRPLEADDIVRMVRLVHASCGLTALVAAVWGGGWLWAGLMLTR